MRLGHGIPFPFLSPYFSLSSPFLQKQQQVDNDWEVLFETWTVQGNIILCKYLDACEENIILQEATRHVILPPIKEELYA